VTIHQQLFTAPRSKPARQLAELHARRRELQRQARDTELAVDQAQRDHDHLTDHIRQAEAHALAHAEPADTKSDRARLGKLERDLDKQRSHAAALDLAIDALADEQAELARDNYDELLGEAIDNHNAAVERAATAIADLDAAQAQARAAFAAAQSIHANAGHPERTAYLRAVPGIDTIVRDGGLAPLVDQRDHAAAA
jgi:hypothetical protein